MPRSIFVISHALFRSCRMTFLDKEHEDQFLREEAPILFTGFHYGLIYLPYHFRDRDGVVMVSASRDGDLIANTMAMFGLRAARGSNTRGGKAALQAMTDEVNHTRCSAGIIADGPKGPEGVAKMGAVELARRTGLPIVPGNWWARRRLTFGSWDRTIVPLPFTRMTFAFEPPIHVAPDATREEMEAIRRDLTRRLRRARRRAQLHCTAPDRAVVPSADDRSSFRLPPGPEDGTIVPS